MLRVCFNSLDKGSFSDDLITSGCEFGLPCIQVGHPAAALVHCNKKVFLALVNVTGLKLGEVDIPELKLKYLGEIWHRRPS